MVGTRSRAPHCAAPSVVLEKRLTCCPTATRRPPRRAATARPRNPRCRRRPLRAATGHQPARPRSVTGAARDPGSRSPGAKHVPRSAPGVACWLRRGLMAPKEKTDRKAGKPFNHAVSNNREWRSWHPPPQEPFIHAARGRPGSRKGATRGPQGCHEGATRCQNVPNGATAAMRPPLRAATGTNRPGPIGQPTSQNIRGR